MISVFNRFLVGCASFFDVLVDKFPYWGTFLGALVLALVLTPVCRRAAIAVGMVDKPGPRRINKNPIPRAGGLAVYIAFAVVMAILVHFGFRMQVAMKAAVMYRFIAFGGIICLVGLLDDRFSLPPLVKLAGQIVVAVLVYFSCHVGLAGSVLPAATPVWIDLPLTVFWMVGAINAFNLIDGLDGLAAGLATISALGMTGAMLVLGKNHEVLPYLAFAGACLGFLRYNFNPASVFLGDTGSMFIGYFISAMPLMAGLAGDSTAAHSLFVSLGVPLLAMGIPIFDTALAILRRSVRAILSRRSKGSEGQTHVMGADADHLHHRLLRAAGTQKAVAITLYFFAAFLVLVGIGGIALRSRAGGLFVIALIVAVAVIVKDMERIELWDLGRLISDVSATPHRPRSLRRRLMMSIPLRILVDLGILALVLLFSRWVVHAEISKMTYRRDFLVFAVPVFITCASLGVYRIAWSRAQLLDVARLLLGAFVGTAVGTSVVLLCGIQVDHIAAFSLLFASMSVIPLVASRFVFPLLRDVFYMLERNRLRGDAVSRMLIYGVGTRFRSFRRELVITSGSNRRVIVGAIDDDPLLKGREIAGISVVGDLSLVADAVKRTRADTVVITCKLEGEKREKVLAALKPLNVKVIEWFCEERVL